MLTAVMDAMVVKPIKGTTRMVGVGIMKVASALWQTAPHDGDQAQHYASFLVKPLRLKLHHMIDSGNFDSIPALLVMMDAIRAIPYVVNTPGSQAAFAQYVNVETLDSSTVRCATAFHVDTS